MNTDRLRQKIAFTASALLITNPTLDNALNINYTRYLQPDRLSSQEVQGEEVPLVIGVDLMKITKDVQRNTLSTEHKQIVASRARELGVTHVAITTPYDNAPDTDTVTDTREWVEAVRSQGLSVVHRHMFMTMEAENQMQDGLYGMERDFTLDYITLMRQWMIDNADLIQDGDIWTPMPEPQNTGVAGMGWCGPNGDMCFFSSVDDFNSFLQKIVTVSRQTLEELGKDVEVVCCGFDGYVTAGNNNPDWEGHTFLHDETVEALEAIAIDHYPQDDQVGSDRSRRRTYAEDLDQIFSTHPGRQFYLTEVGHNPSDSKAEPIGQMFETFKMYVENGDVLGVFLWPFGSLDGNPEGLLDANLNPLPAFYEVQAGFASLPDTVIKR